MILLILQSIFLLTSCPVDGGGRGVELMDRRVDGDDADDGDDHSEYTNGVHAQARTRPDDDNRFPMPVTEGEEGGWLGFLQTLLMADVESVGLGGTGGGTRCAAWDTVGVWGLGRGFTS